MLSSFVLAALNMHCNKYSCFVSDPGRDWFCHNRGIYRNLDTLLIWNCLIMVIELYWIFSAFIRDDSLSPGCFSFLV